MEDEIFQAPLHKRFIASLLDGVVTTMLAIGMFMLLINGAVDIGFHNLQYKLDQYRLQESSSLFDIQKDAEGNYSSISMLSYNASHPDEYKKFVKAIHDYYFLYETGSEKSEKAFNEKYMLFDGVSLKNAIFSISSIDDGYLTYTLLDEVKDVSTGKTVSKEKTEDYNEAIKHFFDDEKKGVYHLAVTEFTEGERFQNITSTLTTIERLEALICMSVATLVFLCLPILINKHSETAFMHVLSICFVDSYGYQVKWKHKIIRAVVTLLLYASSAYLFGAPILVNMVVMLVHKERRSLIDLASNETAIDKRTSVMLEDK